MKFMVCIFSFLLCSLFVNAQVRDTTYLVERFKLSCDIRAVYFPLPVTLVLPNSETGKTLYRSDIQALAVKGDIDAIAAQVPGMYQADIGGALYARGSRSDANQYIIDGVKISPDQISQSLPITRYGKLR